MLEKLIPEEVEGDDRIDVDHDCQQHHSQDKLMLNNITLYRIATK